MRRTKLAVTLSCNNKSVGKETLAGRVSPPYKNKQWDLVVEWIKKIWLLSPFDSQAHLTRENSFESDSNVHFLLYKTFINKNNIIKQPSLVVKVAIWFESACLGVGLWLYSWDDLWKVKEERPCHFESNQIFICLNIVLLLSKYYLLTNEKSIRALNYNLTTWKLRN